MTKEISRSLFLLSAIVVVSVHIFACGTGSDEHERIRRAGWTLEENALQLEEDLFLVGTDDYYFGLIADLDVDDEGRMYVGDGRDRRVKVLAPDGELLQSIGQRGAGPDEFSSIFDVTLAHGDSLYVVDGEARRLSVYTLEGAFQYARSIDSDYGRPHQVIVPEQREGFLVAYTPAFCHDSEESGMRLSLRRVDPHGTVEEDALLEAPCGEKISRTSDGVIQVLPKPFGRQPIIASGRGETFIYGWSDSLAASRYDFDGILQQQVSIPHELIPVSNRELEDLLADRNEAFQDLMREGARATKPAFDGLLVDDEGRLWFKRSTEDEDEAAWWRVDLDQRRIQTTTLPERVELLQVRDGRAYARTESEQGEPALVRFHVR